MPLKHETVAALKHIAGTGPYVDIRSADLVNLLTAGYVYPDCTVPNFTLKLTVKGEHYIKPRIDLSKPLFVGDHKAVGVRRLTGKIEASWYDECAKLKTGTFLDTGDPVTIAVINKLTNKEPE